MLKGERGFRNNPIAESIESAERRRHLDVPVDFLSRLFAERDQRRELEVSTSSAALQECSHNYT